MALNIVAIALILAITFMHSIFGLFSGLLNLGCTIVSVSVAFGFFEPVSLWITKQFGLHPAYTGPCTLLLLFVVSLALLRAAADNLIRGNVHLPQALDTGGAIVCGFLNAQMCVGMLVISVLMLPLGGRALGFSRYERSDESDPDRPGLARFDRRSVWLMPDEFTIGLFQMLSGGALRGQTTFASVYPNFADWVFYTGNTVQWESTPAPYRDSKGDGVKSGLSVESWWEPEGTVSARYRKDVPTKDNPNPGFGTDDPYKPAPGMKLIGVRMTLKQAAADRSRNRAVHLFRPSMLRVVGDEGGDPGHYLPRILVNADPRIPGRGRAVDLDNNFAIEQGDATIDAYFEVPEEFEPRFVEYRRHARASLAMAPLEDPSTLAALSGPAAETAAAAPRQGRSSGALNFVNTIVQPSGDTTALPLKMTLESLRRVSSVELADGKFKSGRLSGDVSRFEPDPSRQEPLVEDFVLPAGWRLCQIRYRPKEALTLVGQVFNYVSRNVNQYRAIDSLGDEHMLDGYFAVVRRGERQYIELFFTGDAEDPAFRSMLDFQDIRGEELTADDSVLGLLFLVPPGRTIVGIASQGGRVEGLSFTMVNQ